MSLFCLGALIAVAKLNSGLRRALVAAGLIRPPPELGEATEDGPTSDSRQARLRNRSIRIVAKRPCMAPHRLNEG